VQAGVTIETAPGSISLQSWYEIYPMLPYEVSVTNVPVSQGDTYFVSIAVGSPSFFYLEDETNGTSASFSVGFNAGDGCTCNSAEAIEEAPGVGGSIANLVPLTNENFSGVAATTSGGDQYLGNLSSFPWTMISPYTGDLLASPGGIGGGSFTVAQTNPNFSITANPSTISVLPGLIGTSTITVVGTNDWPQTVAFGVSVPSGNSASVNPTSVTIGENGSGATTLTVQRGPTDLSTFDVTVTGYSSGGAVHSTTVTVNV
jgi:hypothetical protein